MFAFGIQVRDIYVCLDECRSTTVADIADALVIVPSGTLEVVVVVGSGGSLRTEH